MSRTRQLTASQEAVLRLPVVALPSANFEPGNDLLLDRLYGRAEQIVDAAQSDLKNIFATYGLTRHRVRETQRAISGQAKQKSEPTPNEFWQRTAEPRSDRLQRVAVARITQCLSLIHI